MRVTCSRNTGERRDGVSTCIRKIKVRNRALKDRGVIRRRITRDAGGYCDLKRRCGRLSLRHPGFSHAVDYMHALGKIDGIVAPWGGAKTRDGKLRIECQPAPNF